MTSDPDLAGRPEVVVLVGLPASGKSTFYRQRFAGSHALVSRDRFRNHPRPSRRQRELVEEALAQGRSVVVDNTSPAVADRAAILAQAWAHGARTACYFFGRDVRASIARNAGREGKERVPVVAILATAQRLVAPRADEGFDRLFEVTPGRDGRFEVQELPKAARRGVLVLAAHPDDEIVGAGDLMARAGKLVVVHVTDGAPRDRRFWPQGLHGEPGAYAQLRRRELEAALLAGGVTGATLRSLGARDQEAAHGLVSLTVDLQRVLRAERPALVVTHPYEGGHPDHDAAALVAGAAVALLRRAGARPPRLIEMTSYHARGEALETGSFLPAPGLREAARVLGPAARARKERMLAAFASQREVLAAFDAGVERFRRAPGYDFTAPPHAGPLWYERLGFPITGERWRALAGAALRDLRLAPG